MRRLVLYIIILLSALNISANSAIIPKLTISGHVKDGKDGEVLIGATIYVKELKTGTVTNSYGFYSISLPAGVYNITYSYIGYNNVFKNINLTKDITLNVDLEETRTTIKEVVITDKRIDENINKAEMGVEKLDAKTIKSIPALMGEVDVLKAIQLLPGVQATGDGNTGFNVRGGNSDQNLILLDEATVYNASHLLGFFSVFNNDAVKDIKLYKGDIPAEYGGRMSSLLDIRMKDGNMKKIRGTGSAGLISSRLTIEGPIVKDTSSFIISARRFYGDSYFKMFPDTMIQDVKIHFYDLSMKLNYTLSDKDRLFLSAYFGRDVFKFAEDFNLNWGNNTETFRWNHLFSKKLFFNLTFLFSNYDYGMKVEQAMMGFKWIANLQDYAIKTDFTFYPNMKNTIKFGFISTYHHFNPGYAKGTEESTYIKELKMPTSNAMEDGIFVCNEQKIDSNLTVDYGLRYSIFQNIGATTVYTFNSNHESLDTIVYEKGKFYNTYSGLEPRISFKYSLNEKSSVKGCYSRTMQYLHLASNSTGGFPLDIWLPSGPNIKPRYCDMYSAGYFRNFRKNTIEVSLETYYKKYKNEIDFKDHAWLMLNQKIEGELRFGKAQTYGVEFMIRKQEGLITGWISYTWARAFKTINEVNDGYEYPSNYDKPHNVSVVANYEITERLSIAINWLYATGAAVTFPTGRFTYGNTVIPVYSERNSYRMQDYHRLDISVTLKGKNKPGKKFYGEWNFSAYNAYNRKNTWMLTFEPDKNDENTMIAYKYYVLPIVPSISYNFHF
ncbi:MAG: TonB-dependent receptor [Bacteroidales bacterium]|nr:TonB-dependent receptor [Bacteroidales bacterium]